MMSEMASSFFLHLQDPYFSVLHRLDVLHWLAEEDGLYGFVYYSVTYGGHCLAVVTLAHKLEEGVGTLAHGVRGLDVRRPLGVLKVGDVSTGEAAPVALS